MTILDRYIFKELLKVFMLGLFILMAILTLEKVNFLSDLLLDEGVTVLEFLKLIMYISPAFLVVSIPLAIMLASLIAFSRLSADNEIVAMRATGVSFFRILAPVAFFSIFAYGATSYMALNVQHITNYKFMTLLTDAVSRKIGVTLGERVFFDRFPNAIIYVNEKIMGTDLLKGVFIVDRQEPDRPRFISANRGRLGMADNKVILELQNGSIYSTSDDSFRIIHYDEYNLSFDTGIKQAAYQFQPREMSNEKLEMIIAEKRLQNEPVFAEQIEIYKRYSLPFACLIFGLLGAPLGIRANRGGKWGGLGLGIVMIVINYLLLMVGEGIGREGKVHPALAVWFPNFLMGAIAVFLIFRTSREAMPFKTTLWLQSKWLEVKQLFAGKKRTT